MSIKGMLITLIILPGILHISHGQSINGSHDSSRRYEPSPSFVSYMNPVIPGDHPDCTVTQIGDDFYTTGSSFNVTPVIYHSTDLVHWEAIAQPVSASWTNYEDRPGGGCWGGQMVLYNRELGFFLVRQYHVFRQSVRSAWSVECAGQDQGSGDDFIRIGL